MVATVQGRTYQDSYVVFVYMYNHVAHILSLFLPPQLKLIVAAIIAIIVIIVIGKLNSYET